MDTALIEKILRTDFSAKSVEKIKTLILQLAASGKITSRDTSDKTVDKLVREISTNRKNGEDLDGETKCITPYEIPSHWCWVKFGDIVSFSIGKTPSRGNSSYWSPGVFNWVSIADMKNYGEINETKEKISKSASDEVFRGNFAKNGSILMSFKLTIGKVSRCKVDCFHNEAIISFQTQDPTLTDFLFRFLPIFSRLQVSKSAIMGSTLNKSTLLSLPIALPPLAEQKRIVAKVDELMALCDRLEAQLKERDVKQAVLAKAALAKFTEDPSPENLQLLFHPSFSIEPEDLRRSLLTLAVKGKLTSQSNKDEPAGVLLARVILEIKRTKRKSDDQGEEQPHSGAAFPFCIPNNWQWIGATKVAVMVSDQDKKIPTNGILESGKHPVVDQGKMFVRGYSNDSDKLIKVDEPIILFGDHTRQTKYIDFDFIVGADGVKLLQPIGIDPQYYFLSLRWLPLESRGYARHFKLLKASYIPIPPLEEQHRIVAKVKELEAILDNLENQLEASRTTGEKLLEAMVAELTAD